MSSPVTGSDFVIGSQNQSLCERLTSLLGLTSKVKLWFDWAFDSTGEATTEFKAMFLPPPGSIMAYYLKAPEDQVKAAVERIGRSVSDTGTVPFWRLCNGSDGTPDLRGRFIIGGGTNPGGLTARPVDGSTIGAETVTIGQSNIPTKQHYHGVGDTWTPGYNGDDDLVFIQRSWTGAQSFGVSVLRSVEAGGSGPRTNGFIGTTNAIDVDSTDSSTITPISIMPPALAIWYIMRTERQA